MNRHIRIVVLITLYCGGDSAITAESKALEVTWKELAPLISGYQVTLELIDGVRVTGEVIAVREDSILMDVSTAVKTHAAGNGLIPRKTIALIHLRRTHGSWGRGMGTVLGVMGGIVLGGYAASKTNSAGAGIPAFIGISSGGGLSGYYAGKLLDTRVTHMKVVP